jgi:hypothetical protein
MDAVENITPLLRVVFEATLQHAWAATTSGAMKKEDCDEAKQNLEKLLAKTFSLVEDSLPRTTKLGSSMAFEKKDEATKVNVDSQTLFDLSSCSQTRCHK